MKKFLIPVLFLVTFALLFIGCDNISDKKSDSPVIANIDKAQITQKDFLKEIERVPEWAREQFGNDEGKMKFLEELIKRELIYQKALKMKLDQNKEYLDKVEEFEKMTLVSLILKKEVEEKSNVDEAEVKNFFDQNADKFTIGTKIKASHILVQTEEEATSISDKISKGESFSELAKTHSKDKGSAEKGGDLGYFGRGKMVPEFEQAALALKPGDVSKPVKTRFGFHIIKLIDIQKGESANFEQSKESIMRQLVSEKRKSLFDSYVEKIKAESKITKDEDAIKSITLPWDKPEKAEAIPTPQQ